MPRSDGFQESAENVGNTAIDAMKAMVPTNTAEAAGMASMLAINMAADHVLERAMGRRLAQATQKIAAEVVQKAGAKVGQRLASKAAADAAKLVAKEVAEEMAIKAGTKMATQAAVEASSGPVGWIMLAVQVGGMLLDFFDPFNLARAYTNHDLRSMHDMMAGALIATLKDAKACLDPSFTQAQAATATSPEVICTEDGTCVGMFPGQSTLTPPPTARCFALPFPSTGKPRMPAFDQRIPSVVLDVLNLPDGQGGLLLHNWLANQPNADARVFEDLNVDQTYKSFFYQALVDDWTTQGTPLPPVGDANATNVVGADISDAPAAALVAQFAQQKPAQQPDDGSMPPNQKKAIAFGVVVAVCAIAFGGMWLRRRRMSVQAGLITPPLPLQPSPQPPLMPRQV
jgi:hypothetical protein